MLEYVRSLLRWIIMKCYNEFTQYVIAYAVKWIPKTCRLILIINIIMGFRLEAISKLNFWTSRNHENIFFINFIHFYIIFLFVHRKKRFINFIYLEVFRIYDCHNNKTRCSCYAKTCRTYLLSPRKISNVWWMTSGHFDRVILVPGRM